jgi:hypothetical protein
VAPLLARVLCRGRRARLGAFGIIHQEHLQAGRRLLAALTSGAVRWPVRSSVLSLSICSLGEPTKLPESGTPTHLTFRPGRSHPPCQSRGTCVSASHPLPFTPSHPLTLSPSPPLRLSPSPTSCGMLLPSFERSRSVSNSLPGLPMTCGRGVIRISTSCLGRRVRICSRRGFGLRRGRSFSLERCWLLSRFRHGEPASLGG